MIDKEIIKIASNTENHGMLDNHTHSSKLKNSICGDEMRVYLIIKDSKIMNFKYDQYMQIIWESLENNGQGMCV